MKTAVIIPALNEAGNIGQLVQETLGQRVDCVIVVDNGSTDDTALLASKMGATVIGEPRQGYGYACAAGTAEALSLGVKNGMDPAVLSNIMSKSSGGNWVLNCYNPVPGIMENAPASRDYQGGFFHGKK